MTRSRSVLVALLAAFCAAAVSIGSPDAAPPRGAPLPPRPGDPGLQAQPPGPVDDSPVERGAGVALTDGRLRSIVADALDRADAGPGNRAIAETAVVEVLHDAPDGDIRSLVEGLGGVIHGQLPGMTEARVPVLALVDLEADPRVASIRTPLLAEPPSATAAASAHARARLAEALGVVFTGEEVAKTNADDWHVAGIDGTGVKIGIIDYFDTAIWDNAQTAGEVPVPAGSFCRNNGAVCNPFTIFPGSAHGTGVAEIIHEMAPGAQIYVATVITTNDTQLAVNYFASQGVDIISRSLTSQYDGAGNGTGPLAAVIDSAVSQGMLWVNSAGNAGGGTGYLGSYWRGSWVDADANGFLDFAPGDEFLGFYCGFLNGLRWSDWDADRTDYDLYFYDSAFNFLGASVGDQTTGALPLEINNYCTSYLQLTYVRIQLWSAGSGTAGDVLEFMVNGTGLELWQNAGSAGGPASDSASAGAVTIGAVDPPLGTAIAIYSSQGPTNDARIKPDLSAAACVLSFTYFPCFNGTSSSTPAVAGAAALVLDAGLATSPAELKAYLMGAVVDRGVPGTDNVFGTGELVFGTPPSATDLDGDGVLNALDNCPMNANPAQTNTDFAPLTTPGPPSLPNDITIPNSDALGDACDPDDDNDGVLDMAEAAGCNGSGPLSATDADTDGDRNRDGAECVLGTNPASAASKPLQIPAGDIDTDGIPDALEAGIGSTPGDIDSDDNGVRDGIEYRGYSLSPINANSDGDACNDGREIASINVDTNVNSGDFGAVASVFNRTDRPVQDVDKNGVVNSLDLSLMAGQFTLGAC